MTSQNFADSQPPKSRKSLKLSEISDNQDESTIVDFTDGKLSRVSPKVEVVKEQVKYIDLPMFRLCCPSLECSITAHSYGRNYGNSIQSLVRIDTCADQPFYLPINFAPVLGIDLEELGGNWEETELEDEECLLKFPFSRKTLTVYPVISKKEPFCTMSLEVLMEICTGFELNFKKQKIRLHGVKGLIS